jgi:hypothetical protein
LCVGCILLGSGAGEESPATSGEMRMVVVEQKKEANNWRKQ